MDSTHNTTSDALKHSDEHASHVNTDKYLSMHSYIKMVPAIHFIIENLVRIVTENKIRLGHDRALEFGGGPSLLTSFVLAQQVKSILFSDYVPHNLTAVEDWIKQTPNAHDWSDLFNRVIQEYEQQTGDSSAKRSEWEKHLREAIKHGGLSKCDVNADHCPILSGKSNQYDIVSSTMYLERACETSTAYKQTIHGLYTLLKEDGLLILIHELNETYYIENEHRHTILPLNRTIVIDALRDAGFEDIHDESQDQEAEKVADGNIVMVITAFKPKTST